MKVEFLKSFSKDLDNINSKQLKSSLIKVIELMESAEALTEISSTKKLKGHKSAYRVRIGITG